MGQSETHSVNDIRTAKSMGFNMLRKHIKIEPLRWYYHCDRLGMIVWQDMVSGGQPYSFLHVSALPTLGKVDLPECEANAKLIESAPKLLAALERCVRYGGLFPDLAAEAAAVITEATGG